MFKRTAVGEIIDVTAAKSQGKVVSCIKSQTNCGSGGQENIDLLVFEKKEVFSSASCWSMMNPLLKTFS